MRINIPSGKYIVAVSGGVDSVVLLDILSKQKTVELVAAHFNHGIRGEASADEDFVRQKAKTYGLPFETGHGNLGPGASEAVARQARYEFLRQIKQKHEADNIITAHHQDDLIETALINIIRGTGPKGLIAISTNKSVLRPLLGYPKLEIVAYAKAKKLNWVEDATNLDNKHLRNYVRNVLVPKMSAAERQQVLEQIKSVEVVYSKTDGVIAKISQKVLIDRETIKRSEFIALPPDVATKLLVLWLNNLDADNLDKKTVLRLANALKTAPAGSRHEVRGGKYLSLTKQEAHFTG